ncbi:MAG: RNA polymerase sigma-70 factor [Marinifilum sp.]|nr:RNA polymerase sigma-70 factor [Marinifilum sp.]
MLEEQIKQIIKGDKSAFELFFHNYYGRLLKYAVLLLKDDDVAEDIVQEAFVNLWKQRKTLDANQSLNALIYKFVRNRCINYLRDNETYLKNKEQWCKEELQHVAHYDFLGKEEVAVEDLILQELDKAIEGLPDKCKQVFILNKMEGIKQSEIAEQLNLSVKMVEKHVATAKSKLKKQLTDKFPTYTLLVCYVLDVYFF